MVVATTLTVYVVPLARPVSVHDSAVVVEHVAVPGDADTVYPVTVAVPAVDADQYTTPTRSPRTRPRFPAPWQ